MNNYNIENKFIENIIIGSGPSGSITALKLKENNKDTLIIEKGNYFKSFKHKHPGKEFLTKWEFGGLSSSVGNSEIKYAAGECYGGGSEINSGLFHLPDKKFLANLTKDYKIKSLKYKDLIKNLNIINDIVKYNLMKNKNDKISDLIIKNAKKIKWKYEIIPRFLNKEFKRSSMSNSILKKYQNIGGKTSLNTEVISIKKEKKLWHLNIRKNKKVTHITCKNLFLCAGTINTISLLKKNKLVDKSKISRFHFHPMIKVIGKFKRKINKKLFDISSAQINHFFPEFIIGNASSSKTQLKINSYTNNNVYLDINKDWEKMAIFHVTFSLGEGKLITILKKEDPIVSYKINKKELRVLNKGLNKLISFLIASGCEYVYPIIESGYKINRSNFKNFNINSPKKFNLSTVHLLGGCPFGEDNSAILNSFGKVKNQNNLYVNDGSLICGHLVKNPQGIIMSLAYRNVMNFIKN